MPKTESLRRNTLMLYVFSLASYLFAFVTLPYQTRVLGPGLFGRVSLALVVSSLFNVLFEFGFLLSGTARIASTHSRSEGLRDVFSSITYAKLILILVGSVIMGLLIVLLPSFAVDPELFLLFFISSAVQSLMPDFLYRGLERMTPIAVRTVISQGLSVALILILVRGPSDYLFVPIASLLPNILALFLVYLHLGRTFQVSLKRVPSRLVMASLRESSPYFLSRFAGRMATSANVLALSWVYPVGAPTIGVYASVDRLISAANRLTSPLADSLYPYMLRTSDYRRLGRIIAFVTILVVAACGIAWILADHLAVFVLGEAYVAGGGLLRILLALVAVTPMTYLLGFPALSPVGAADAANRSAIAGSLVHLSGVVILIVAGRLDAASASYVLVISQIVVLVYRIAALQRRGVRLYGAR